MTAEGSTAPVCPEDFPPIADLVPHAAPMLAVEDVLTWSPGVATCRMTVRDGAPMVRDGRVPAVAVVEYLGQAVAACCGGEAYLGGEGVRYGVIIGCRSVTLERAEIAVGTELMLDVRRTRGNEMLSHFVCEARDSAGVVGAATMTVFHAEDMPQ